MSRQASGIPPAAQRRLGVLSSHFSGRPGSLGLPASTAHGRVAQLQGDVAHTTPHATSYTTRARPRTAPNPTAAGDDNRRKATNLVERTRYKPRPKGDPSSSVALTQDVGPWNYVFFGFLTVEDGSAYALRSFTGALTLVQGPTLRFLFNTSVARVKKYLASPTQFLRIQYRDGRKENVSGPHTMFFHPGVHLSIQIHTTVTLNSGQAIVVYERSGAEKGPETISRFVVHGPAVHIPKPNQWIHNFFWHVPDQSRPTYANRRLLRFQKLRTLSDSMYFDIEACRTRDDALLTIKLMIFYQLVNVEAMVDGTSDPVAGFINGVTADVIEFVGSRTLDTFKEEAESLNNLSTYSQLSGAMSSVGYTIQKVVYRGYIASAKLQQMHDSAIEERTKLALQRDRQAQHQDLVDLKQQREHARNREQMKMETDTAKHQAELRRTELDAQLQEAKDRHTVQLNMHKEAHDQQLQQAKSLQELEVKKAAALSGVQLGFLRDLQQNTSVDLTAYLVAKHRGADKIIQLQHTQAGNVGFAPPPPGKPLRLPSHPVGSPPEPTTSSPTADNPADAQQTVADIVAALSKSSGRDATIHVHTD